MSPPLTKKVPKIYSFFYCVAKFNRLGNFFESTTNIAGYKKLTDVMLWNLSKKLTTQSDVRTLAYELGMTGSEVDRCFTNHQYDINACSADSVERVAYKKLCDVLEKVQMNALIYQALFERAL